MQKSNFFGISGIRNTDFFFGNKKMKMKKMKKMKMKMTLPNLHATLRAVSE